MEQDLHLRVIYFDRMTKMRRKDFDLDIATNRLIPGKQRGEINRRVFRRSKPQRPTATQP
jgi:hypothetical protein